MAPQRGVEIVDLFPDRQVPDSSQQVLQRHETAPQTRFLGAHSNPEVALQVPRAVERVSRPTELHRQPLAGRVEDWRAGRPRYLDRSTSPAPSTSHATCGFPALRAPICFMPRLMGPILPGRLSARRGALDSRETASGCCTATAYSIAPSRSPVVSERAPNGA